MTGAGDVAGLVAAARRIAAAVPDPELPMLTLGDLGILREVRVQDGELVVSLTPTYSGCPAMHQMQQDVAGRLAAAGLPARLAIVLSPPWSSDWISADGRRKLAEAGLAPPHPAPRRPPGPVPLTLGLTRPAVACPRCGAGDTRQTAAFSGTACKALYRCGACGEPFEYIKEI